MCVLLLSTVCIDLPQCLCPSHRTSLVFAQLGRYMSHCRNNRNQTFHIRSRTGILILVDTLYCLQCRAYTPSSCLLWSGSCHICIEISHRDTPTNHCIYSRNQIYNSPRRMRNACLVHNGFHGLSIHCIRGYN